MGYNIYIGELGTIVEEGETHPNVQVVENEEAPSFTPASPLIDKRNKLRPSYTAWDQFCEDTGLQSFFFDGEHGLFRQHPGFVKLTSEHLDVIKAAIKRSKDEKVSVTTDDVIRLLWLEFWIDWALHNCTNPVILNN